MHSFIERCQDLLRRYPWAEAALLGFLPGALFGVHLALLLLFLNPEMPLRGGVLMRMTVSYGLLVGAVGALAMILLCRGHRRRARRLLPWGLTLAVTLAALLAVTHASHFAFYLPPGINSRLLRGGMQIGGIGLILFYTSLLHSFRRRPYGLRSRSGILLLCLVSIYVMGERRVAFHPGPAPIRASIPPPPEEPPRLLVVGIEGATLDALLPLAEQGRVPFLAEILRSGASARLVPLAPHRRLTAWKTLATGKYPYRHGVTDPRRILLPGSMGKAELQLLPTGIGFSHWGLLGARPRPIRSLDQRALDLWQILSRRGTACGMVGWPAPTPVASELRFALAEEFFDGRQTATTARPEAVAQRGRLFQVSPEDLDPVVLGRFGNDPPLEVRKALAADRWRQGLSLFLLEQQPTTGALFIHQPGLGAVSRLYAGGLEAVQLEGSDDPDDQRAAELLAAYYGQLDVFLQALWQRSGEGGLLAVVSPIGFSKPRGLELLRKWAEGDDGGAGTTAGAPDGLLMLYGARVAAGARLADAATVDLVPTLLYGLGYPVSRDLDGKVLTGAFDGRWREQPLAFVPTYENLTAGEVR